MASKNQRTIHAGKNDRVTKPRGFLERAGGLFGGIAFVWIAYATLASGGGWYALIPAAMALPAFNVAFTSRRDCD